MNKNTKVKLIISASILLVAILGTGVLLIVNGMILPNNPSAKAYPIRGVDVSWYQGDIEWDAFTAQGIDFAFIKATEGSSHVDKKFYDNFEQALNASLQVGAYHFFSYDSAGKTQAENFIKTLGSSENISDTMLDAMLPPVVDIEFYGDKKKNLPQKDTTQKQLSILLDELEKQYGKKPIIYATKKSYDLYIANDYTEYDIWIRSVYTKPTLSDGRAWTFWQYTDKEQLDGYAGVEKFIDVNVFYGTQAQWGEYVR